MRMRSALLLLLAACGRGDPGTQGTAQTPQRPAPDPVITDTRTIYVAHGIAGGPAWTVAIFGEGIRYTGPGRETGVVFPPGRVDGNDSASHWVAKRLGSAPNSIGLALLRQNCTDRRTDTVYAYRAMLTLGGAEYPGCASGGPPTQAPPAARGRPHQP